MYKYLQMADAFLPVFGIGLLCLLLALWFCLHRIRRDTRRQALWKFAYWLLAGMSCVPGVAVIVYPIHTLYFSDGLLPDVRLLCYVLPILVLLATLGLTYFSRGTLRSVPLQPAASEQKPGPAPP